MKKQLSLTPLYVRPLIDQTGSFVKFIGSGTGLGKSFSALLAFLHYVRGVDDAEATHTPPKNVLAFFLAPQHNQISFPSFIAAELANANCSTIKVKPVSDLALSDLEKENNAYDITTVLFFNASGKTNTLYQKFYSAGRIVEERIQKKSIAPNHNPRTPGIPRRLDTLKSIKNKIDRIKNSEITNPFSDNKETERDFDDGYLKNREDAEKFKRDRLNSAALELAGLLTSILKTVYTSDDFHHELNESLSVGQLKELRGYSAAFYPFLDYQSYSEPHALMGMTVSKLLTKHLIFTPKLKGKNKDKVIWIPKLYPIDEILSDKSRMMQEAQVALEKRSEISARTKFFECEIHIYLDESDASKEVINDHLNRRVPDSGLVQAIGANAKEVGDIVFNPDYRFLLDRLPKNSFQAYHTLTNSENDDSLGRQAGKEALRHILNTIIKSLFEGDWAKLNSSSPETETDLLAEISKIARTTLSAPYATVDASLNSGVLQSASLFGGESFGFIGSSTTKNLVVELKQNSLTISQVSFADNSRSVSLASFFALVTISWFLFRTILKYTGSVRPHEQPAIVRDEAEALINLTKMMFSEPTDNNQDPIKPIRDFINKINNGSSGALMGVSAPFTSTGKFKDRHEYHTVAARSSMKGARQITETFFSGTFSPKDSDLANLIGSGAEHLATQLERVVDMEFAHHRGHTIYGLVEVRNDDYMIDLMNKAHVAFPFYARRESAEGFLSNLLDSNKRRTCCFCMSATGAFLRSHIPAWSIGAMQALSTYKGYKVLSMSREDYALTVLKQQERGLSKTLSLNVLPKNNEGVAASWLCHPLFQLADQVLNRYANEREADPMSRYPDEFLLGKLSNPHKRFEAQNALDAAAITHDQGQNGTPKFSLVLVQTHRIISALLRLACRDGLDSVLNGYEIRNLFSTNTPLANSEAIPVLPGIFLFGETSRVQKRDCRPTLIVCYTAALERLLAKIFKDEYKNEKEAGYQLKRLLGMVPQVSLKDVDTPDFNAINYLMTEVHDCNVVLISAFQSAARGVNFIVNKDTGFLQSQRKKKPAKGSQASLNFAMENNGEEKITTWTERDMDSLYVAAEPYYSQLRQPESTSDSPAEAQGRFFMKCQIYLYYLEFKARQAFENPALPSIKNVDLDLNSPLLDSDAETHFEQQHRIALVSQLMQGLGRMERTNAEQTQNVVLCFGASQIMEQGLEALTEGLSDQARVQITSSMSVVNAHVAKNIHERRENNPDSDFQADSAGLVNKHQAFEARKRLFLDALEQYRQAESQDSVPESIRQQVAFYEAFRSPLIIEQGIGAYLDQLESAVEGMPALLRLQYRQLISMLFIDSDQPIESVSGPWGSLINLEQTFRKHEGIVTEAYRYEKSGRWLAPAPCFISDFVGNYGESLMNSAIKPLLNDGIARRLDHKKSEIARNCFELGDAFLISGERLLVIDAKHYGNRAAYTPRTGKEVDRNERIKAAGMRKFNTITERASGEFEEVLYLILNTHSAEDIERGKRMKSLGGCVMSLDSQGSTLQIEKWVRHLFVMPLGAKKGEPA